MHLFERELGGDVVAVEQPLPNSSPSRGEQIPVGGADVDGGAIAEGERDERSSSELLQNPVGAFVEKRLVDLQSHAHVRAPVRCRHGIKRVVDEGDNAIAALIG